MTAKNDGGPAFPVECAYYDGKPVEGYGWEMGMSLRDWVAGQALAGMGMWQPGTTPTTDERRKRERAEWAYAQADAMLAARKTEGE